ncbi:MAG: thymidylate synthase [Pseudooceanicola sp.]
MPLALATMVAGCGDGTNPFTTGDLPGEEELAEIPESIRGDLEGFAFNATAGTLVVYGLTLDEVPTEAVYTRQAALDAQYNGYQVYTAQDDPLDRHSTALVLQSPGTAIGGRVRGGIVVTGGPRNRYFGGGYYERDGSFDPPTVSSTSGLVSYAGAYAGLSNIGVEDGMLLPVDPSTPTELRPSRAAQVTGDVFINADFADNRIEGNIYNRTIVPTSEGLPSMVLVATDIDGDGRFVGNVEYDSFQTDPTYAGLDPTIDNDVGDYAGLFGGNDASAIAGVIKLDEMDGPDDRLGYQGEEEYGVFVLQQCGAGASSSVCDDVR